MSNTTNGASAGWHEAGESAERPPTRFRYARAKVRSAILAALVMTAMVTGLTWMLLSAGYHPNKLLYTALSGLVFFAFVSAAMLLHYWRNSVVVAVLPTGLVDLRWQADPVPWEAIREIVLRRVEDEYELDVHLWPGPGNRGRPNVPDHVMALAPLDASAAAILAALRPYADLRIDRNSGVAPTSR
jgi:hypothetical protein